MILAEKLDLPVKPSDKERLIEISVARKSNLIVDDVLQLPFPDDITSNWIPGSLNLPNLTREVIKQYARDNDYQKSYDEGANLCWHNVKQLNFDNILDTVK